MTLARGLASIFSFRSYREFLKAYVNYRKRTGQYSLARLSADLGFQSANYASLILSGKRNLSLADVRRVARFLKMQESEARYLILLVQQNDTDDPKEKTFYKSWLDELASRATLATLRPADYPGLLNEWYIFGILACLHTREGCSLARIKALTGLKTEVASQGLDELVKNQLARRDGDLYFSNTSEMTNAQFGAHFRFKEFQALQLERSQRALKKPSARDPKFASNTFLLDPTGYEELISKWRELITGIDVSSAPTGGSRLIQMNLQIFDFKDGNN